MRSAPAQAQLDWPRRFDSVRDGLAGEALLTVDQNLEFQQDVSASRISVIVAITIKNRLKELRPLVPKILDALNKVTTGEVIHIRE